MTTTHTPGPWATSRRSFTVAIVEDRGDRNVIGEIYGMATRPEAEVLANASLIAAAPELLEALKDAERMLVVAMRNDLDFGERKTKEIIDGHTGMKAIRAAIAKATKGAP